jgi:hypothetical protein
VKITLFSPALALAGISAAFVLAGCPQNAGNEAIVNVGTSTIKRTDLGKFLEARAGQEALPYLIDTQLILEEAKSKGIEVSEADVDADLARRQAADPSIAESIKDNAMRTDVVKEQIRRELTMQRLLVANVKSDDAKVKAFFDKNRKYYDVSGQVKIGLVMTSQKSRAEAMERALKSKTKTFEALVEEQQKAQDPAAQGSSADRGPLSSYDAFGTAGSPLRTALEKTKKGDVTSIQTIPIGQGQDFYAIFKIVDKTPDVKADLTKLRPTVETDYKMYEVAVEEIKKNPANPQDINENLERVAQEISMQQQQRGQMSAPAPTMRDILTYILGPKSETIISGLRTAGTVSIADPVYAKIGETYKPAPAADATPAATGAPAATPTP